jgi:H+/Cl- antiporter ClcA
MKPGKAIPWRRYAGIVLLGFVSLGGVSLTGPGRDVLDSARSFMHYYQALEKSGVAGGFFERVVFSLVLASADAPGGEQPKPAAMSSS